MEQSNIAPINTEEGRAITKTLCFLVIASPDGKSSTESEPDELSASTSPSDDKYYYDIFEDGEFWYDTVEEQLRNPVTALAYKWLIGKIRWKMRTESYGYDAMEDIRSAVLQIIPRPGRIGIRGSIPVDNAIFKVDWLPRACFEAWQISTKPQTISNAVVLTGTIFQA